MDISPHMAFLQIMWPVARSSSQTKTLGLLCPGYCFFLARSSLSHWLWWPLASSCWITFALAWCCCVRKSCQPSKGFCLLPQVIPLEGVGCWIDGLESSFHSGGAWMWSELSNEDIARPQFPELSATLPQAKSPHKLVQSMMYLM